MTTNKELRDFFLYMAYTIEGKGFSKFDLAGATIYGITKKYHPNEYRILKRGIKTKDKAAIDRAIFIAYSNIFEDLNNKSSLEYLPDALVYTHFDFYFNAGRHALNALQLTLKHVGLYDGSIDGIIGPKTKLAMTKLRNFDKYKLVLIYDYYRSEFYLKNKQKIFRCGWMNRIQKIESFILDMT